LSGPSSLTAQIAILLIATARAWLRSLSGRLIGDLQLKRLSLKEYVG
jgi:hypothetical protein